MSNPLPSLLLLPPSPVPATAAAVAAAYRPALVATVSSLKNLSTSTKLLIVLPCSNIHGKLHGPRADIYGEVQELVGRLYSLICLVCAKAGAEVDSDTPGAIDARVLLLDYDSQSSLEQYDNPTDTLIAGPIIDLPVFAVTRRQWNIIFSVDGEEGQKILALYMSLANRSIPPVQARNQTVSGGVSMVRKSVKSIETRPPPSVAHTVVAVGGTFDHLHAGHKLLLTATALLLQPVNKVSPTQRRLIIGITGDELLKNKKYAEYLKSWKERQEDVVEFLLSILSFTKSNANEEIQTTSFKEPISNGTAIHTRLRSCSITIECVEIQDPFGPTITDESITALVVSGETRSGGKAVNDKRIEKGWQGLEVYEIDVLDAQDIEEGPTRTSNFASKISSTAIRKQKSDLSHSSSL
ncbi:hypothetical protein B7494_g498 [Chlorociboria aeruginascens]|nr:hypothetical protein B7494_g498 [Chlorociboria aeruginascens]